MQGEQQTHANLLGHLQQLQAAKGQKLAMFGPHATLRQLVDSNRYEAAASFVLLCW